jgi:hypothetical protein
MKITNADVIKSGEKDLIDSITADLDWGAIEEIFLTEHNLGIDEDIEYKKGDIIAHDNQVAYKLEFTVKVNLSILINRDGEYLSVKISERKAPRETGAVDEGAGNMELEDAASAGDEVEAAGAEVLPGEAAETISAQKEDSYLEALGQLDADGQDNDTGNGME